ncbi:MAG TPA: DUF4349 domain-containing protein [Solirubrobacteraceae bacterium]|jgi:hypothetical protein|nr:DUF4349 domain-containing protein [Solirubrobacteraceae bacterium]
MPLRERRTQPLTPAQIAELEALDAALAGAGAGTDACAELGGGVDPGPGTELDALVRAVRDARPPLRPAFADELGVRVAGGFPRPAGGARSGRPARRWLVGLGAAASVAIGVVAIDGALTAPQSRPPAVSLPAAPASGGGTVSPAPPVAASSVPGGAPAGQQSAAQGAVGGGATAAPGKATSGQSGATSSQPAIALARVPAATGAPRAVESDASLSLLAARGQVQHVADEAIAATDRLGGVVESSQVSVQDGGGSQATLALEVPSSALDRTLAALSSIAHVTARSQDTQDITDPTDAARQRLSESRAERVALLRQLATATTPNRVASIHGQLGLVDGRITTDQANLQALVGRAAESSVSVTITEAARSAAVAGSGPAWGPGRALHDALRVLEACFSVLVIALAGLVPVGAVAVLAWWTVRAVRRRARSGALA